MYAERAVAGPLATAPALRLSVSARQSVPDAPHSDRRRDFVVGAARSNQRPLTCEVGLRGIRVRVPGAPYAVAASAGISLQFLFR